jgi:hypothetical protein
MSTPEPPEPTDEPLEPPAPRVPAGDLNPEIRALRDHDPLLFAEEIVAEVKPEIIENVIADNPDGDMEVLSADVEEAVRQTELGFGLMAVQVAAQAKKAAYLDTDDTYYSIPYEEMQRILKEEGFTLAYHEAIVVPDDDILHDGEYYPRPDGVFEIWFNPEGTVLHFDTSPQMEYTITPPMLMGQVVNSATLEYNWQPDPATFVYYSDHGDEPTDEWRQHVQDHHYGNFTSSGHFVTQTDEEWEDKSKRVWAGNHQLVDGGFRYVLHNLRANGRFLPEWVEAYSPPAYPHYGDTRMTAYYRYKGHPEALVAARDQVAMRARDRYEAFPDELKQMVGPFHTWETRRELRDDKPVLEAELPSIDYLTDTPDGGVDGPELS